MHKKIKVLLFSSIVSFAAIVASAQVTLENFTSTIKPNEFTGFLGTWSSTGSTDIASSTPVAGFTQNSGFFTISSPAATNSETSLMISYFDVPLNLSGLSYVILSAEALSTNTSQSVRITLFDDNNNTATAAFAATEFPTGSFTTASQLLTLSSGFNPSAVAGFIVTGGVPSGVLRFNYSFDNLAVAASAIPEPSTYAAILGLLALGFVAYRRRLKAV